MTTPIVIIELLDDKFEALYGNMEIRFIIVNRNGEEGQDEESDARKIAGPYTPTLEKSDLTSVIEGIKIPQTLLTAPPEGPYFCLPDPYRPRTKKGRKRARHRSEWVRAVVPGANNP